jgi:hypothetical protein
LKPFKARFFISFPFISFFAKELSGAAVNRANGILRRISVKLSQNCLPNEEDASRADNEGPIAVEEIRASLKNGGYNGLAVNAGYFPLRPAAARAFDKAAGHGARKRPYGPSAPDLGKSNSDLGKSNSDLGKSNSDLGKSGTDLGKSGSDLGKFNSDLGKSGSDLGKSDSDLGKPNSDLGKSDSDLGKPNSDLGKFSPDLKIFFLARGAYTYTKPTIRRNQNVDNG